LLTSRPTLSSPDHLLLIVLVVAFGLLGSIPLTWPPTLDRIQRQLEVHELRTLLLSRLFPGGLLPVLLAAAMGGYPWRRFAVADIEAARGFESCRAQRPPST
jgi:hypothetical protein